MYTIITEHIVKEGQMKHANELFDIVSRNIRSVPGFKSRYVLLSEQDPSKIVIVTSWESKEAFKEFYDGPSRPWLKGFEARMGADYRQKLFSKISQEFFTPNHVVEA